MKLLSGVDSMHAMHPQHESVLSDRKKQAAQGEALSGLVGEVLRGGG